MTVLVSFMAGWTAHGFGVALLFGNRDKVRRWLKASASAFAFGGALWMGYVIGTVLP